MVINRQRRFHIALLPLEEFLGRVKQQLGLERREVSVCLVSDPAMARLNQRFRGKSGPTDVLSFPHHRNGASRAANSYLGDIAISPASARRNARRFGRSFPQELRVLILHGVLHLMGYDHETDRGQMDRLEARLRRRFGLSE